MKKKNVAIFKIILTIIALAIIIAMIIYLFPLMKNLSSAEGQVEFKNKVQSLGILGMLLLLGMEIAQIFLIILPGEPIEIVAGMCYGSFWGTIFIMISSCLISTSIFLLVRKFGRKFIYNFCDENKVKKIENNKIFQNPKTIEFIMLILFLIPGTPKDLLVYVAGLLPIKPIRFVIITTFARFPSVITSTLAGHNLVNGDWKMSIMLYLVILIIVAIIILIINKLDKSNTTKHVLKSISKDM